MRIRSVDYIYAGFWPRAAAYLIDSLIVSIPCFAVRLSSFISNLMNGTRSVDILFDFSAVDIICYIIGAFYFTFFTWKKGCTLGKYLMRLTVITEEGTRLSFVRALYRETIGRFLTGILYIGYLVAAWDNEKCGFHDRLSDTRVVYAFDRYANYSFLPKDPRTDKRADKTESTDIMTQDDSIENVYEPSSLTVAGNGESDRAEEISERDGQGHDSVNE